MKYIDADQIRAEIERRREANKRQYHSSAGGMSWQRMCGEEDCLIELLSFLDSLPEQPVEGLEEEMDEMWLEYCEDVDYLVYSSIARHFAEWGAKHLKPNNMEQEEKKLPNGLEGAADKQAFIETPYCWESQPGTFGSTPLFLMSNIRSAFKTGAEWQKAKILDDAIEIEVKEDAGGFPIVPLDVIELYDYENDKPLAKAGDKVRVIVIKED